GDRYVAGLDGGFGGRRSVGLLRSIFAGGDGGGDLQGALVFEGLDELARSCAAILIDEDDGDSWHGVAAAAEDDGEDGEEGDGQDKAEGQRGLIAAQGHQGGTCDEEEFHISRAAPFR